MLFGRSVFLGDQALKNFSKSKISAHVIECKKINALHPPVGKNKLPQLASFSF